MGNCRSILVLITILWVSMFDSTVLLADKGDYRNSFAEMKHSSDLSFFSDTIPSDLKGIPSPWNRIEPASENMKPGYPFAGVRMGKFPWLPVTLGAAGGGAALILLTTGDSEPEECKIDAIAEIISSTCGRADGSVRLKVDDQPDVRFDWSNGSKTEEIGQLPPGTYTVTMTKGEDECRTIQTYTVNDEIIGFETTLEVTDADCGRDNGKVSATAMPEENYNYNWSNGANARELTGLGPGMYSLTVSLGETCENSYQVEVGEKDPVIMINYTVSEGTCVGGGDIVIDLLNSNSYPIILVMEGPSGIGEIELVPGNHSLGDIFDLTSGNYVLKVYEKALGDRCSVTVEVEIPDNTPDVIASDDEYKTGFEMILEDNVLTNDQGLEISLTDVSEIEGGDVTWQGNGDFAFRPADGFSGEAKFNYTIRDACDSQSTAEVIIEVLPEDCDFTITREIENASCGFNDGVVTVSVNEPGNYRYEWENGEEGPVLPNVSSGSYTVYIEEIDLGCILDFVVIVEEEPAEYYQNLSVQFPICSQPGEIIFEVATPGPGPMVMEVFHPNGDQVFNVPPGLVFLSDYVPMVGGQYKVILYDESIGMQCMHDFIIELPPVEIIEIALDMVVPPSSPSNTDGVIFCTVIDPGPEPYAIFLNGQFRGNFSGSQFSIEGLGVGEYQVWITDREGCMSNIIPVLMIIVMDPVSMGIRGGLYNSLLPSGPEHPKPDQLQGVVPLEIYYKQPLPLYNLSMEVGIGYSGRSLTLRSDLRWQTTVTRVAGCDFKARAAAGAIWSEFSGLNPYVQLGPSIQRSFRHGIILDIEVPLRSVSSEWQLVPACAVQIPFLKKTK